MPKKESYIKSSYDELINKDDFDGIPLGLQSLKGVAIASIFIALIIYLMDQTFSSILNVFYSLF